MFCLIKICFIFILTEILLYSAAVFLSVLTLVRGAPVAHNNLNKATLHVANLQDRIDGIPKNELPELFLDLATEIEKLHLREIFQRQTTDDGEETEMDKTDNNENTDERVKRADVDLATLCQDQSCIGLLKQYEQWRQEHGYAYYTGVWKVGK